MIDFSKPYKLTVEAIAKNSGGNVMLHLRQDIEVDMTFYINIRVNAYEYSIEYTVKHMNNYKTNKMILDKNNCDTDVLFQMSTVHPFYIDQLQQLLTIIDRGYDYVMVC